MLSIVSAELETDIKNCHSEGIGSSITYFKNHDNTALEEKEVRMRSRHCKISDHKSINPTVLCQNIKLTQNQQSTFSSTLSDPFDDFVVSTAFTLIRWLITCCYIIH